MTKFEALANFLEVEVEEVEQGYNEFTFEAEGGEFLVVTDNEADQFAADEIKESVWAFNTNFIIEHSSALDFDEESEEIVKAIQEKCEDGNKAILKLIDDLDEFVEDAVRYDGRGHFLAKYDGEENEEGNYYIYRTN